ncbi:MAG TPA: hypothetical protein ENK43_15850 [Planctomycetes bacterium]|nr:hypothetical protein [Planctomycetota bacterium]
MTRLTLTLTAALALAAMSPAQNFNFSNFSSTAGLQLNGSAAQVGAVLRINPNLSNQTGAAFTTTPHVVLGGFDTTFQFRITPPLNGTKAEGMAFVIQNSPAGANALGGAVWGIGYGPGANASPLANSLAIEIDTFQDGFLSDTSSNELTVHTNGPANNNENEAFSIGRVTPAVNMSDGASHTMRVLYVPGTLDIFLDNLTAPVLSVPYDFTTGGNFLNNGLSVAGLNLPSAAAHVGFTATTGAGTLTETVDILSWSWISTPLTDPCFAGNVGQGAGGPFDILTVNGSSGGFFRRVTVPTFQPITLEVGQPPTNPNPADFILFGVLGAADGSQQIALPFGAFCFPLALPVLPPGTFILADTFGVGSPALLPATPTPWQLFLPTGIPFAATATYQAVVAENASPLQLAVSNGLILDVVVGPPPTITGINPPSALPGAPITVSGTGFVPNLVLTVDGNPVTPTLITDTQIVFPYPAGTACGATLTVTHPDGQSAATTLNPQTVINNAINPQGPAAGGANLIILGAGFGPGTTVTIGGNPATVNTAGATVLAVTTPPGPVGPATVVVTSPGGCSATTTYTYL